MIDRLVNNNPFMPDVPFHLDPLLRPPKQQPITQNIPQNIQEINPYPSINLDIEESSPFQESIMSETIQRPDKKNHFFQNHKELGDLINKRKSDSQIFTKTNRYRQNTGSNTKESIKRHSFACRN